MTEMFFRRSVSRFERPSRNGHGLVTKGQIGQKVGKSDVVHASSPRRRRVGGPVGLAAQPSESPTPACGSGCPRRPAWKSSNACTTSSRVFMTNGPAQAIGSRMG